MEYKYTYQDWVHRIPQPENLLELFYNKEIPYDDYFNILSDKERAYLSRLKGSIEMIKESLNEVYEACLIQDDFIEYITEELEDDILKIKSENDLIIGEIIRGKPEYHKLNRQDVEKYLSDWEKEPGAWKAAFDAFYKTEDVTHFDYIIKVNVLTWIKWLKKQRELNKTEPSICFPTRDALGRKRFDENLLLTLKPYTWPSLFKDPEQADKILTLIDEHLSSTGQWITEPKGRFLVALYTELQSKGYLKSGISAPRLAAAFNSQFDTTLASKNFQPNKLNEAEDKREYFKNLIPTYRALQIK